MRSDLELARRFRRLRALVVGDVMLDTYLEGVATRLCREGPAPVVQKTAQRRVPGGAGNVAANLRALGAEVALLGVVGRDAAGAELRQALRGADVDDALLLADAQVETLHKLRVLANGQYLARFDEGGEMTLAPESEQRLLASITAQMARCDVVIVSDYSYGVLTPTILERLRALRATYPSLPLLVDAKHLLRHRAIGATVVTPNEQEARELAGARWAQTPSDMARSRANRDLGDMDALARHLLTLLNAGHVAVTLSGDGALVASRDGALTHIPAQSVRQASDVGAGDSFAAALALTLGAGGAIAAAARIGVDAAGIAVSKQYTSQVSRHELLQRISLREHLNEQGGALTGEVASRRERQRLAARLALERQAGRTIVFTNGIFDALHAGHVAFLRQARALGDLLVVGVNSDRSASQRRNGRQPQASERDRLALVAALDPVGAAVLFDEQTPVELIRLLRPHIHVKGGDYADEALPEDEAVREVGGRVVILPLVGAATTPAPMQSPARRSHRAPVTLHAVGDLPMLHAVGQASADELAGGAR